MCGTWHDVGHVHPSSVVHLVLPNKGAALPITVVLVRAPSIPVHTSSSDALWHCEVYSHPCQRPAQGMPQR